MCFFLLNQLYDVFVTIRSPNQYPEQNLGEKICLHHHTYSISPKP